MEYVTFNLTPGRYFYNFEMEKVAHELEKINYRKIVESSDFIIFSNKNSETIKIRKDGSVFYDIPVINFSRYSLSHAISDINKIIDVLNLAYDGLLNSNNVYIIWPDGFKYQEMNLSNYTVKNVKVHGNCFTSILSRNLSCTI